MRLDELPALYAVDHPGLPTVLAAHRPARDDAALAFLRDVAAYEHATVAPDDILADLLDGRPVEGRLGLKLGNVLRVLDGRFFGRRGRLRLTAGLLCRLHADLMDGLLPAPGRFRRHEARPANSAVVYEHPARIAGRLDALLGLAEAALADADGLSPASRLRRSLAAGALLYSEFLAIHPFPNGNGRTARLALALALRHVLPFPLSVRGAGGRAAWLALLEARAWDRRRGSPRLARYVAAAAVDQAVGWGEMQLKPYAMC